MSKAKRSKFFQLYMGYEIWVLEGGKSYYLVGSHASVNQLFRTPENAMVHADYLIVSWAK